MLNLWKKHTQMSTGTYLNDESGLGKAQDTEKVP